MIASLLPLVARILSCVFNGPKRQREGVAGHLSAMRARTQTLPPSARDGTGNGAHGEGGGKHTKTCFKFYLIVVLLCFVVVVVVSLVVVVVVVMVAVVLARSFLFG